MVNRMVLILVCFASIFGLCMFQVQAADVDANNKVVSVHLYVLFTSDEGGEFPLEQTVVLEGEDFRIYSFRQTDAVNGTFSSGCYVFSPEPFYVERYGVRSLFDTPFEVDGNVIYYCSIGGWSSSAKDEQYTNLSGFQNLNYCPGSPSDNAKKIAEEMARAGYYDYDDSEWATDREQFSYFSLSGFQCDDSVSASWNGILTDSQLIKDHVKDIEVVVSPSFFLILEPGEKYQEFPEPESYLIPINQSFKRTYDSFFEGNPYKGRALLTLDFYPRFYDSSTGNTYRGNSISVKFDVKGKITDVDFPESSLIPVYDSGCYFDSPASTTVIDSVGTQKTFFRWNKVFTSYVYKSNYIVVDIGYKGKWYSYSSDDFFSFNSISLTWKQVKDFLSDYIEEGFLTFPVVTDGYKIRYTPYYKTSSGVYYGKSIIVSVSGNATTESITEVDGDYLDTTNPPDFVDKTPTDWFEDTSIWDNVEHVTDHIKDDIEGNVNLDNLSFNFFKMLKAVINACGQFPTLVATVFSFLPTDISRLLVISLSLIIILRILGR